MNEPTSTPNEVVPVSVPLAGSASTHSAPAVPSSSDQLPTVRFQSLPPPLPPPRAPLGPAHKTQPLRPITREAALATGIGAATPWRAGALLDIARRAAVIVLSPLRALLGSPWSARRIGISCAAIGATMVVGSLVAGWEGVSAVHPEKVELAPLAVAAIYARTVLAVAAMAVGYGLLRVGERTLRFSGAPKTTGRDVD